MVTTPVERPSLGYCYKFEPHELNAIRACNDAHGFAVVKRVLAPEYVEELKQSIREVVDPTGNLARGESRFCTDFIEHSRPLWRLLEDRRYLDVCAAVLGSREMSLHRSAGIMKAPGAPFAEWHTDYCGFRKGPPRHSGDVLNVGEFPSGFWFYLTGTHPARGGLALIEDSHRPDWPGPAGFDFTENRSSFHRKGTPPAPHNDADVPGAIPLFTDPGDLIIFAARTYHGVFPHDGDEPRLSLALNFRAGREPWPTPWKLPESARLFIESVPPAARPLVEHYPGLDKTWRGA